MREGVPLVGGESDAAGLLQRLLLLQSGRRAHQGPRGRAEHPRLRLRQRGVLHDRGARRGGRQPRPQGLKIPNPSRRIRPADFHLVTHTSLFPGPSQPATKICHMSLRREAKYLGAKAHTDTKRRVPGGRT